MDYTEYVNEIKQVAMVSSVTGTANLLAVLPNAINYAELRIYREFNFLATQTADHSVLTTPGVRRVMIPDLFIVVEGLSLILPAGFVPTQPDAERVPLLRVSRGFCDVTWPIETRTEIPKPFETYYSIYSDNEAEGDDLPPLPEAAIVAPTPDKSYYAEFTGTARPAPLSPTNTETILTRLYPDIFFAASMIWISGWQRNFGAQADDPQKAVSWEMIYKELAVGVSVEETRKRGGMVPYGQAGGGGPQAGITQAQAQGG